MTELKPLSQSIVAKNQETIGNILHFYSELNLPAYIRIETGTYERLIITPVWQINFWLKDKSNEKLLNMTREEFFAKQLNPYTLCSLMHGKESEYSETLEAIVPGMGVLAIDYESEELREMFEPIVVTLNQ